MRMKLFAAPSLEDAMEMVRAELGEDAIILSECETDNGWEVRAAVERSTSAKIATPMFDAAPRPEKATNHFRDRMRDVLVWHGAPEGFAQVISNAAVNLAGHDSSDELSGFTAALEDVIGFAPVPAVPDRSLLVVGSAGAGKTATTAKLVRRAAAAGKLLSPVCADFDATSGVAQLSAYLQTSAEYLTTAVTPNQLESVMRANSLSGVISVVDTPPINPFDSEDLDRLGDLISMTNAEPLLVLSAEGHPYDLEDSVRSFAALGIRRCVVTKLDVVRRRGGVLSAVAGAKVNISHLAMSPHIGAGLIPATPARLAQLLVDDAPGAEALKGAA